MSQEIATPTVTIETNTTPKETTVKAEKSAKVKATAAAKSEPQPFSGKAYLVERENYLLSVAVELIIADGLIVSKKNLTVSDLPGNAIGAVSKQLWTQLRGNQK